MRPASESEKRNKDYHRNRAHYTSVVSGKPLRFDDAILGHAGTGASGHWNTDGHRQDREANYRWNQLPENYHGPEHWQESSASGAAAERYRLPGKDSHASWLKA